MRYSASDENVLFSRMALATIRYFISNGNLIVSVSALAPGRMFICNLLMTYSTLQLLSCQHLFSIFRYSWYNPFLGLKGVTWANQWAEKRPTTSPFAVASS